jgi:uncharacterized membrane protein SirB2
MEEINELCITNVTIYRVYNDTLFCIDITIALWIEHKSLYIYIDIFISFQIISIRRGRRIRDRMVVGFATACAISACHH